MSRVESCLNIEDLRLLARQRLPKAVFDYLDGFAEDGASGRNNRASFDRYRLVPRVLRDVVKVDTRTRLFGQPVASPLVLAPTALSRLFHHHGELAVAPAAAEAGLVYSLSTVASYSIEEVAKVAGVRWFQLYMYSDKGLVSELIERAGQSGYTALCLTVDAAVMGKREQDIRNGFAIPPRLGWRAVAGMVKHPAWLLHHLGLNSVPIANLDRMRQASSKSMKSFLQYMNEQLAPSLTWQDIDWLRDRWDGPLIIKGLSHPDDARMAQQLGVNGMVLSNHGGRQLDHSVSSMDVLPAVVEAVGDKMEVMLDGGFRRGTDVVKALALGARACLIGRPYLYGLAAGGRAGVDRALAIFLDEIELTFRLLGCPSIAELDASYLHSDVSAPGLGR